MIRNEIYAYQELEIRQDRRILDGSGRLVETFVLSWVLLSRRPISEFAHKGWKLQARMQSRGGIPSFARNTSS